MKTRMGLNVLAYLRRNPTVILYISVLLYTLVLSYLAILKHYAFMSTAWDLGIYEQVLWSTANTGRLFWYTAEIAINPSCNFFGIHFSPILFLVLPVYTIFQATETLLVLQSFFLALGAVPLYKLVFHESRSSKQALVFAFVYLGYPPIYGVSLFDFHVQAFLPFLFLSAFYYLKKEEWSKYFLFIILSLIVIEFVPLIVVFFGLYGLWINRKKLADLRTLNFRRFLSNKGIFFSAITIILGVAWFIISRQIILGINPSAPPHPNWSTFGDPVHNIPEFFLNVLANPIKTFWVIFTPVDQKALYIFGLFMPVAFLSFLDLPSLMIGGPWFVVSFLSDYPPYYTAIGYQYVAFVVSFIFISAVYGVKRLFAIGNPFGFLEKTVFFSKKTVGKLFWRILFAFSLVFIIATSYLMFLGNPLSVPSVTEHNRLASAFTRLIPSEASVLTQNDLFPHLSRRQYIYIGGTSARPLPSNITFDYIFMDAKSPWYEYFPESFVFNLTKNNIFSLQYAADGIWLFKKNYTGEVVYPIDNGVFVDFYNQGVLLKFFDDVSPSDKPAYEDVALSIYGSSGVNIPEMWDANSSFVLIFEGCLYAPISGNYSFLLESTGSSEVHLDGELVLNSTISTDYEMIWLERGFHSIKVEYEYQKEDCYFPFIHLLWKPPWETGVVEIHPAFLYSKILPDVSSPFLGMSWDFGSRSPFVLIDRDHFSAFVNCSLYVPTTGVYKFKVSADGYAFASINGKLILNPFENATQDEFEVFLNQGKHMFQIEYLKLQGNNRLSVVWQPPNSYEFEEIPSSNMFWQGN